VENHGDEHSHTSGTNLKGAKNLKCAAECIHIWITSRVVEWSHQGQILCSSKTRLQKDAEVRQQ
jgi:hypothetical protein